MVSHKLSQERNKRSQKRKKQTILLLTDNAKKVHGAGLCPKIACFAHAVTQHNKMSQPGSHILTRITEYLGLLNIF